MSRIPQALKRKLTPVVIAIGLALLGWDEVAPLLQRSGVAVPSANSSSDLRIAEAFQNRENDLQIAGAGTVVHILPDDTKGSQHQRFLLELASGQTLLVAHNIDLAPRVNKLTKGDEIKFYGEYEWTDKGGVIHWTHHDPGGRHVDGWLEHDGRRYE